MPEEPIENAEEGAAGEAVETPAQEELFESPEPAPRSRAKREKKAPAPAPAKEEKEEGGDDEEEDIVPVESLGRDESLQVLYALLFVADRPLSPSRLSESLGDMDPDIVATLLEELREKLDAEAWLPYFLQEIAGGYQLVTKPQFAPYIRRFLNIKKSKRLSRALLETLAIIAYKQPVTRPEVEAIRGVSVSHAFDQLQERRLVKVAGVSDLPGRPKLYRTTDEFLVQFGLSSLKELPTLDELKEMGREV